MCLIVSILFLEALFVSNFHSSLLRFLIYLQTVLNKLSQF